MPPDLSLMAKARGVSDGFPAWLLDGIRFYQEGGVNYIHGFLTGYEPTPEGVEIPAGTFYNPNFVAAAATAMPPMLQDNAVQYDDGTPTTLDQHAKDVAAFLMWTAEPKLVERKHLGFMAMIFLVVLTVLLYLTKRQIWSKVKH
jgi:ubiquinol-cytochrome c reductase cytochrome c1 subunit